MFLKRLSAALVTIVCFSTLAVGANSFTQTDATNTEKEIPLAAPLALKVSISGTDISCYNENDGEIRVDVTDYAQPIKWKLLDNNGLQINSNSSIVGSFTIPVPSKGKYRVSVTDEVTITPQYSNYVEIEEPKQIIVSLAEDITPIYCTNGTGSMKFTASSDFNIVNYSIKNTDTDAQINSLTGSFTGLVEGNYIAWAEDENTCTDYYNQPTILKLEEPADLNEVTVVPTQISCFGETGSVKLNNLPENSGVDAFTLQLRNTRTSSTSYSLVSGNVFVGLDYGSYSLTMNRTGCTPVEKTFEINKVEDVVITANATSSIDCFGETTSINVKVEGGKSGEKFVLVLDDGDGDSSNNKTSSPLVYGESHLFTEVSADNYTIMCIDQVNSSCVKLKGIEIPAPLNPLTWLSDPVGIAPKCYNGSDGSIQVNVSGGTKPYTYIINGTSGSLLNRSAGTYNVKIQDLNLCETDEKTVTITQPDPLVVSPVVDVVNVNCPGGNDGEIHLTATGGSGSYKYDLTDSTGTIIRSNVPTDSAIFIGALSGGIYDVQVYEATNSNCIAPPIPDISITEPEPLSVVSFDLDTIQCDGDLANLTVQVTGGSGSSYTFKLYSGASLVEEILLDESNQNFSPLIPGSYTLKVWRDITCDSLSVPFTVVSRKKLVVANVIDSIMIGCSGDPITYTLTVSGEGGYSYSLDNGANFFDFPENSDSAVVNSGLFAHTTGEVNRFMIKDQYECQADYSVTIYEPTPIVISDFEKTDNTCSNKSLGKVFFNLSGGIPGYTIKLLKASTSEVVKTRTDNDGGIISITGIPAGTYTLDIKDSKGCSPTADLGVIEIISPDSFLIETPVYDSILCYNGTTDVQLSVLGGWAVDKTIRIYGGVVDTTIVPGIFTLKAGTYTLTARNTDGCRTDTKFTINQPDSLILKNVVGKDVSCNNANDATISFVITGGVGDYSYGLEGTGSAGTPFAGSPYTIENVEVGEYNLVVADGNLCSSNVVPVSIHEPDSVTFTYKTDSVSCFGLADGVITLTVQGGTGTGFRTFLNGNETTNPIRNLAAGTYEVQVKDSKDCVSKTEVITVGEPGEIVVVSLIVSDSVSCNNVSDGSLTINASGGLPYALQFNAKGTTSGGTEVKRGYQDSNVFENLPGGEYVVYATIVKNGTNFCSTPSSKITIINPDPIKVDNTVLTNVSCHNLQDGKAVITAAGGTGGLVYSLIGESDNKSNNIGVFTDLGHFGESSTTYHYSIVDDNQCTLEKSFTIINPDELTIDYLDHFQVRCNDEKNGWIKVKVEGGNSGYTFKKDIGESVTQDVESITANTFKLIKYDGGNFTPVVIDSKGCSDTLASPVTIVNPDLLVISSIDWGEKECYGYMTDTTIIHVAGGTPGYFYSLDRGDNYSSKNDSIFIGELVGNKYAVVKDSNGCVSAIEDVFVLTEPEKFSIEYEFTGLKCYYDEHGDMKLDIQGGTGPYSFSFNDPTFASPLSITKSTNTDVTTIKLSDQGVELVPNITYKFYLKDDNGCHVQNVTGLKEFTEPFADTLFLVPDKVELKNIKPHDLKCQNQQTGVIEFGVTIGDKDYVSSMPLGYTFTAYNKTHEYSKTSDPGSMLVNGLLEGDYELSLVDENGCVAATNMTGFSYDPENINWGIDTASILAEFDSIKVLVSNIVQPNCDYWFDGSIEVDIQNFRELGVTYIVELYDSLESRWDQEYEDWGDSIKADPAYMIDKTAGHELYFANKQKIVEEIGIGRYKITVSDVYSECTAEVIQDIFSVKGDSCPPIDYYNAFTPLNGDGQNDEWEIFGSQYQSYTLQVFTAFGELVYSKKGISDRTGIRWDGLDYKGRPAPVGTYIYILKKFEGTPQEVTIDGNITILRANGR